MFFGKGQSKKMLGDSGESESFQSQQTRGDFRVEQPLRFHAEFGESRKILQGIMQNPYRISDGTVEIVPIRPGQSSCPYRKPDARSASAAREPCEEASSLQ